MVLASRLEKYTACTLGSPPPPLRNAEMRSPMPYKHATSLTALLAGILKSGSRYGSQAYTEPCVSLNQRGLSPWTHFLVSSQCSRTCGGGTQNRRVTCRQLLTDGSFLNLSEELCQGPKASSRKSCARTDCPPHWTVGDWSKVRAIPTLQPLLFCSSSLSAFQNVLPQMRAGASLM